MPHMAQRIQGMGCMQCLRPTSCAACSTRTQHCGHYTGGGQSCPTHRLVQLGSSGLQNQMSLTALLYHQKEDFMDNNMINKLPLYDGLYRTLPNIFVFKILCIISSLRKNVIYQLFKCRCFDAFSFSPIIQNLHDSFLNLVLIRGGQLF